MPDKPVSRSDGKGSFIAFEDEEFEADSFDIEEIKRRQDKEFDLQGMAMSTSAKDKSKAKTSKGKKDDLARGLVVFFFIVFIILSCSYNDMRSL